MWSQYKNIKRHTAHTIVSWPNPKQWVIGKGIHMNNTTQLNHAYFENVSLLYSYRCCVIVFQIYMKYVISSLTWYQLSHRNCLFFYLVYRLSIYHNIHYKIIYNLFCWIWYNEFCLYSAIVYSVRAILKYLITHHKRDFSITLKYFPPETDWYHLQTR